MMRAYARFTVNHPIFHSLNLVAVFGLFILCCYQLLVEEELVFGTGFFVVMIAVGLFAGAADYRSKYLSRDG
ncbi:hypothetical protein [Photobacterium rosenbergii]|uniref:hypothetical protein n=1 Tax=Photobacterium rosenbergii TaxID=294936 RepID=UPI001C99E9E6|nr:hypothetical protein [Photobacterium rosenbergii]MBY5947402.1 hypothetical protein [Photobacterium rosenbergii]